MEIILLGVILHFIGGFASGIVRLDVFIDLFPTGFPHRQGAVYLLDAEGNRTAEARFIN